MEAGSRRNSQNKTRKTRKMVIAAAGFVVLVFVLGIILVTLSNRILEYSLRRALGEDLKVESISLRWNGVDANGVRFLKEGETVAYVKKLTANANFLTILTRRYSISQLTLDEPMLKLEKDRNGEIRPVFPGTSDKSGREQGAISFPPLHIKTVTITNGSFSFKDERLQKYHGIEAEQIKAQIDDLSFPLRDTVSKVTLDALFLGDTVAGSLRIKGKLNLFTKATDLSFQAKNVRAFNNGKTGPEMRLSEAAFTAVREGGLNTPLVLSDVTLKDPFLRVEVGKTGRFVSPLPSNGQKEKKQPAKNGKNGENIQAVLKNIKITGGELLYLDGKITQPPNPVRITDINITADQLGIPFRDSATNHDVSARIPGRNTSGQIKAKGVTNLGTLDTHSRISVQNLDITTLKPYIEKKGDADVTRGSLDMNMDLSIKNRIVYAPTKSSIRNLELASGKGLSRFMGIPRTMLIKSMETSSNRIDLDFTVEGDLDNPQFKFGASLIRRFTVEAAKKLGLSVVGAGETAVVQGGKAVKGVGSGLKNLGRGIKNLFR